MSKPVRRLVLAVASLAVVAGGVAGPAVAASSSTSALPCTGLQCTVNHLTHCTQSACQHS